jgi:hypothetical protein
MMPPDRMMSIAILTATLLHFPVVGEAKSSSNYCYACARDSHGHIARSSQAKQQFMRDTGYPRGRPGYVVDHIVPLKRGGPDSPSNMQWQTRADAKAKDKWE